MNYRFLLAPMSLALASCGGGSPSSSSAVTLPPSVSTPVPALPTAPPALEPEPESQFFDGGIRELCHIGTVTSSTTSQVTVKASGQVMNMETRLIETNVWLYKIRAVDIPAYEQAKQDSRGEMGRYAAGPRDGMRLEYVAQQWTDFYLEFIDTSPAYGDLYVCGLSAVSLMEYRVSNITSSIIEQ